MSSCLRDPHISARLQWCRHHQRWDNCQWNHVMFSDESRFTVDFLDRHRRDWCQGYKHFHDVNVIRHDPHGGGSVMVRAVITAAGRTDFHVVAGRVTRQYYRDNILVSHVVAFARHYCRHFIFQDDNARCNRARIVTIYLQQNISRLPWPALSPDLSPIEYVWDMLGQRIRQHQQPPANVQELAAALQQEWNNIPQIDLRCLFRSMPSRIRACRANQRGFTRYCLGFTMALNLLCDPVFVLTLIVENLSFPDCTRGLE